LENCTTGENIQRVARRNKQALRHDKIQVNGNATRYRQRPKIKGCFCVHCLHLPLPCDGISSPPQTGFLAMPPQKTSPTQKSMTK
jgi:hypothetical protein